MNAQIYTLQFTVFTIPIKEIKTTLNVKFADRSEKTKAQ